LHVSFNSAIIHDMRITPIFLAFAFTITVAHDALAIGRQAIVKLNQPGDGVALIKNGAAAPVYIDPADHAGVLRAAGDLRADLDRAGAAKAKLNLSTAPAGDDIILVGTLGKSALIDRLASAGKDRRVGAARQVGGLPDRSRRQSAAGRARALVVVGSDKRGTILRRVQVSEQIGVSPWYWWADVAPCAAHRPRSRGGTRLADAPVVRYRGIFLNDEAPAPPAGPRRNSAASTSAFYEQTCSSCSCACAATTCGRRCGATPSTTTIKRTASWPTRWAS
jgi:hypothetical protein